MVTKRKQSKPSAKIGTELNNLDEADIAGYLLRLLFSMPPVTHNSYSRDGGERLEAVAKRYRVNVQKISEAVGGEFAARRQKTEQRRKRSATAKAARKGNGA